MSKTITRRVGMTAITAGTNSAWEFEVTVMTAPGAKDSTVRAAAMAQARRDLDKGDVAVSSLAVTYIISLDE